MIVQLPAEMVLARAREVHERLVSALAGGEPLELDARDVEKIDVAGLQLLGALCRSAEAQGRSVTFRAGDHGAVVGAAAERAGFNRHQGCTAGCLWVGHKS